MHKEQPMTQATTRHDITQLEQALVDAFIPFNTTPVWPELCKAAAVGTLAVTAVIGTAYKITESLHHER